jgi:hypothetical protein
MFLLTAAIPVTFPADTLHGSYAQAKKAFTSMTKQQYVELGMKLAGAEGKLGADYPVFLQKLKQMTAMSTEYADDYGNMDYDALPVEKREEAKRLLMEAQPYFDRLNDDPPSKELLSVENTTGTSRRRCFTAPSWPAGALTPAMGRSISAGCLPSLRSSWRRRARGWRRPAG